MNKLSRIMLVEDNSDDADLVVHAFEKAGIQNPLFTLADGDSAAAYIGATGSYADRDVYPLPGLVLLDLKLPRRSGFEVLEAIRSDPFAKLLPVVVLTSSDQRNDVERAYTAGANSYLVKPATRDALLSMVKVLDSYWIKLNRNVVA